MLPWRACACLLAFLLWFPPYVRGNEHSLKRLKELKNYDASIIAHPHTRLWKGLTNMLNKRILTLRSFTIQHQPRKKILMNTSVSRVLIVSHQPLVRTAQKRHFTSIVGEECIYEASTPQEAIDTLTRINHPTIQWFISSGNFKGAGVRFAEQLDSYFPQARIHLVLWTSAPPTEAHPRIAQVIDKTREDGDLSALVRVLREFIQQTAKEGLGGNT